MSFSHFTSNTVQNQEILNIQVYKIIEKLFCCYFYLIYIKQNLYHVLNHNIHSTQQSTWIWEEHKSHGKHFIRLKQ